MAKESITSEGYQKLMAGADLPEDDERTLLEAIARGDPHSLPHLCHLLANQKRQARQELAKEREARSQAEAMVAHLREPPLYPAEVLRVCANGRLDVTVGGRRQLVVSAPELDPRALRAGDEVFLNRELSTALMRNDEPRRTGVVATVAEVAGADVMVRGVGDEDFVAACAPELAATLRTGDRVLYRRETQCVIARLPERRESLYVLDQPPRTTFADIGGMDDVIAELRRDLDLHLTRPDVVMRYRLQLLRGITLVGPPGTGKTLLAGAVARHLGATRGDTRFLHVKPGLLRGVYYGQSEIRIRELFAVARTAPGLVVIFFDELDNFGARGGGAGQDIDGRVLDALLAEIDGLESAGRILCIGATNRLDLCDTALVRPKRLGDRIYTIPRPGRAATRQILAKYLSADLPYAPGGDGMECAAAFVDAAVGYLYAPAQGGAGPLASVTLANGDRREVVAADVVSGALIASAIERAKHVSGERFAADGTGGLSIEDVLMALDDALTAEANKIRAPHAARQILDFSGAEDIVRVEIASTRRARRYRYLRAA